MFSWFKEKIALPVIASLMTLFIVSLIGAIKSEQILSWFGGATRGDLAELKKEIEVMRASIDNLKFRVIPLETRVTDGDGKKDIKVFSLIGWTRWGYLQVDENKDKSKVIFNGYFDGAAGYVQEGNYTFGGNILVLNISGSTRGEYTGDMLLKFQANDRPLKPLDETRVSKYESTYINVKDGPVSFRLPTDLRKLEFVFFSAKLNELTISGNIVED